MFSVASVLAFLASAAVLLLVVFMAQQRTSQSADLAALAGAERVWAGTSQACGEAVRIASERGHGLLACDSQGLDVQVVVSGELPGPLGPLGGVRATARAGPPED